MEDANTPLVLLDLVRAAPLTSATNGYGGFVDWIAVGICADVPAGTVVPRKVNDTDLAIWCSAAGIFHAWADRCPHRGMRLSHGFVRGETLACIYHGWQYDSDGACVAIPAHPGLTPPKAICATHFDCQTQDGVIWVALAPTQSALPDTGARQPVRSVEIAVPAAKVAAAAGQPLSCMITMGGTHDLALALQPCTSASCVAHVLAGADQSRKDVSRHLEVLRAEMEAAA